MLKKTLFVVAFVFGCSDPTVVIMYADSGESASGEDSDGTGDGVIDDVATDGTGDVSSETGGSESGTGSGSDSATVVETGDTGPGTDDTGSGTGDSDTVPACWLSCMPSSSYCQPGSVVIGRCPNAEWCCEPKVVDTDTGTGTGTGVPCTGTCANSGSCGGDWHKIDGACPNPWQACCEKDADTGSATVDSDTNPQPCPVDDPKYSCEWRVHCEALISYREDTNYFCLDPGNKACCRHL